jgi:signal transduction histidine kinase
MGSLTEAFLLLSREMDQGLTRDWVCVNDVAAAELEQASMITGGEAVTRFESEDPIWVFAPEKVVESIVGNLVRNAVTYTGEGEVLVRLSGDTLLIEDTGPGMDPEQMKNLFKPFVRRQRQRGGFGVGLTIVKRLTGRFEWPLNVESQLGQGTRATVRFPNARRAVPRP